MAGRVTPCAPFLLKLPVRRAEDSDQSRAGCAPYRLNFTNANSIISFAAGILNANAISQ